MAAAHDKKSEQQFELRNNFGLWSGVSLLAGTMVGSGIFVAPVGVLAATNESVGLSLVFWVACGLLSGMAALCYAELGTSILESGASYAYLNAAYSAPLGFMFLLTYIFFFRATGAATQGIFFGTYLTSYFFPGDCDPPVVAVKCAAVFSIIVVTMLNYISVKAANKVQIVFTIAKFSAMGIIIIGGFTHLVMGDPVAKQNFQTAFDTAPNLSPSDIGLAFYQGLYPYAGWSTLNFVTEEMKNPGILLPRCITIAITSVTAFYLFVNIAYFSVLTTTEMLSSDAVAITFANRVLGSFSWIIPVLVCMSILGSANGSFLASGRLAFVGGRRGQLPQILSMVHVENYTPGPSIILGGILAIIFVIPGNINTLVQAFSFTSWTFFGLCSAGVLILRKTRPDLPRPYKVPFVIPIIVSCSSVYLVIAPLVDNPDVIYLYAITFMFVALLLYYPLVYRKFALPGMDRVTVFLQEIMNAAPTDWKTTRNTKL